MIDRAMNWVESVLLKWEGSDMLTLANQEADRKNLCSVKLFGCEEPSECKSFSLSISLPVCLSLSLGHTPFEVIVRD